MKDPERPGDLRLEAALEGLLASYATAGGINHLDEGHNLPSPARVVEIIQLLEGMLFLGYFQRTQLEPRDIRQLLGKRCARLRECLGAEIAKSLVQGAEQGAGNAGTDRGADRGAEQATGGGLDETAARARAEQIVFELLEALPSIREMLREDAQAALDGDPAARSIVEVLLAYPSIRVLGIHRVAHFLHRRRVPLIPRMMSEHVHGQTGIDIHPGATIGAGLFIDHGTGVVIGETAVLGEHCKLYQGVTLGALSVVKHAAATWAPVKRHPTLEDRVTVYAGATILGGQTIIGAGSVVGGNVWLTRSIPEGTTVQIEPPFLRYRGAASTRPGEGPLDYQI